jgi:hypothetical protein
MMREVDTVLEKQVGDWIEAVTCKPRSAEEKTDIHHWLQSGEVLCCLANEIKPGSISKFNADTESVKNSSLAAFKRRENISIFIRFCRDVCHVHEKDLFSTDDLFEAKDMQQVLSSLFSLGGVIQKNLPEFSGPKLGVVQAPISPIKRRPPSISFSSGAYAHKPAASPPVVVSEPAVVVPDAEALVRESPVISTKTPAISIGKNISPVDLSQGELERCVVTWIEKVLNEKKSETCSAYKWLKTGEVLCRLINTLKPGSVVGITAEGGNAMKVRENISKFIRACREFGVRESDLFTSVDLYEGKNFCACLNCVYSLGGVAQAVLPDWNGPTLGKKQSIKKS